MAMTIVRRSPSYTLVPSLLPASTTFVAGEIIARDTLGTGATDIKATSTSTNIKGTIINPITASDPDFASTKWVMLESDPNGEWELDVTGADANDVGNEIDLSNSTTGNPAASAVRVFAVDRFISSTKLRGRCIKMF